MVIRTRDLTSEEIAARDAALVDARAKLEAEQPKKKRAPAGSFDRTAYQRELMRKRRAAARMEKD